MQQRTATIAILAVMAISFTLMPALSQDDKNEQDQKKLAGSWSALLGDKEIQMSFEGKKWTLKGLGDKDAFASGTLTIDATQNPKTMDMAVMEGKGEAMEKYVGKTSRSIYDVDGDTLKWCANEPGKDVRPKEFNDKGSDGNRYLFLTFKRNKN